MATKKEDPAVKEMNVYQKLQAVREEFYEAGAKKTGKNLHAEFMYYELKDIVPLARPLFTKYGLFMYATFKDNIATAYVENSEDPLQSLEFEIPMLLLSEPAKFRMNEIQGMGSAVTYYRRYLYMLVLDLVDSDNLDNQDGKKNPLEPEESEKPKSKKPATQAERKEIKSEIVQSAEATEEDVAAVKAALKRLMTADPEQEDFVQEVAMKTNGFTTMTHDQCWNLINGINEILKNYEG